jgi:hypothetical protein
MTNFGHDLAQLTATETHPQAGDHDDGNDNNGVVSYSGGPTPSSADLRTPAAGEPPWTFEDANPQDQYTRGAPQHSPIPVRTALAPRAVTRATLLTGGNNPIPVMILGKNAHRVSLDLMASASATAALFWSNDPAALAGQGFPVPSTALLPVRTYGEVYVLATGTGNIVLYTTEYLDN